MFGSNWIMPWWVGPIVALSGVLFLIIGGTTLVNARRRRRTWIPRKGRVIGSRLDGDGQLRLQVAFTQDGRQITFWNRFTSTSAVDPVGRDVDVLANPADPTDAVVVGGAVHPSFLSWVFLVFGAVVTAIGVVLST